MLQLTLDDGNPVAVNPNVIATAQPSGGGTTVMLSSGKCLEVREAYAAVSKALGTTPIEEDAGPVGFSLGAERS